MCLIMLFVVLSFESCLKPCWLETFSTRDYVLPPCQHPRQIIPLPFWCQISWNPLKRSLRVCVHKKEKKNTQTDLSDTLMATTSSLSYIHPSLALTSLQSSHSKSRPCLLLALIFLLKKNTASSFLFGREAAYCSSVLLGLQQRPQKEFQLLLHKFKFLKVQKPQKNKLLSHTTIDR